MGSTIFISIPWNAFSACFCKVNPSLNMSSVGVRPVNNSRMTIPKLYTSPHGETWPPSSYSTLHSETIVIPYILYCTCKQ
jgi:hypothetical protein